VIARRSVKALLLPISMARLKKPEPIFMFSVKRSARIIHNLLFLVALLPLKTTSTNTGRHYARWLKRNTLSIKSIPGKNYFLQANGGYEKFFAWPIGDAALRW
jgi:hypothetical protein